MRPHHIGGMDEMIKLIGKHPKRNQKDGGRGLTQVGNAQLNTIEEDLYET